MGQKSLLLKVPLLINDDLTWSRIWLCTKFPLIGLYSSWGGTRSLACLLKLQLTSTGAPWTDQCLWLHYCLECCSTADGQAPRGWWRQRSTSVQRIYHTRCLRKATSSQKTTASSDYGLFTFLPPGRCYWNIQATRPDRAFHQASQLATLILMITDQELSMYIAAIRWSYSSALLHIFM